MSTTVRIKIEVNGVPCAAVGAGPKVHLLQADGVTTFCGRHGIGVGQMWRAGSSSGADPSGVSPRWGLAGICATCWRSSPKLPA